MLNENNGFSGFGIETAGSVPADSFVENGIAGGGHPYPGGAVAEKLHGEHLIESVKNRPVPKLVRGGCSFMVLMVTLFQPLIQVIIIF